MWRNKTTNRRRGGFGNQRRGQRFGKRYQQRERHERRGEGNWNEGENDHYGDGKFKQETRHLDHDSERSAVHIGFEIEGEIYSRDNYQDNQSRGVAHDRYEDENISLHPEVNSRNIDSSWTDYNETSNPTYWNDRGPQGTDTYHDESQVSRNDDFYEDRGHRRLDDQNLERYDREFQRDRFEIRNDDQAVDQQRSRRDSGTYHYDDDWRHQDVHSGMVLSDDRDSDNRAHRHNWKDDRHNDDHLSYQKRNLEDHRQDNTPKLRAEVERPKFHRTEKLSEYKPDIGKRNSASKGHNFKDKSGKPVASSTFKDARNSSSNANLDRSASGDRSRYKSGNSSRREHKSTHKEHSRSKSRDSTTQKTEDRGKNNKPFDSKTDASKNKYNKQGNNSTDVNKHKSKKHTSSSVKEEHFKKPLDKTHQHRQRSNSDRKVESDVGVIHEEDILSIMADDDGFEREMKTETKHHRNTNRSRRESRERTSRKSVERKTSKERGFELHQIKRETGRQNISDDYDSNHELAFKTHTGSSFSGLRDSDRQVSRFSDTKASARKKDTRVWQNRYVQSGHENVRRSGRNNNCVGGRSRLSVASKIRDSYLKRRHTYQKFDHRGETTRQNFKSANVQSHIQNYGKKDVGKTGAVLKYDRVRGNDRYSNLRDRHRSSFGVERSEQKDFKRNPRVFSNKQNFYGISVRNRFPRDKPSLNSGGSAYQQVKRKYFKGNYNKFGNSSRNNSKKAEKHDRKDRGNDSKWDRKSVVEKNSHTDELDQVEVESNQQLHDEPSDHGQSQLIFIPNADMQTSQPHLPVVDQYGQIIVNPDDSSQSETHVPVQYLPQQFHSDAEQVVFIPFVNNQPQSGYVESLGQGHDDLNYINEDPLESKMRDQKNSSKSGNKRSSLSKKPLSKRARLQMRKYLENKRKQRMEKQIEQKVLAKLLKNPEISKVMQGSKFDSTEKKNVIKRISPPESYKLKLSGNEKKMKRNQTYNRNEFEDVSEDDRKYDSVSDLEDVSEFEDISDDADDCEERHLKRPGFRKPGFRKPGQPRIRKTVGYSNDNISGTSGDIRKVINQSSNQEDERTNRSKTFKQNDTKQKPYHSRSVYIEDSSENVTPVIDRKRGIDMHESSIMKRRRSISPIEITVSNDHYSVTAGSSRYENTSTDDPRSDKKSSDSYRFRSRPEGKKSGKSGNNETKSRKNISEEKQDDHRSKRKDESNEAHYKRKYDDRETQKQNKHSKTPDININSHTNSGEFKHTRNSRGYNSGNETGDRREGEVRDTEKRGSGKYEVKKGFMQDNRKDVRDSSRSRDDKGIARDKNERRGFSNEAGRRSGVDEKDARYSDRKRNELSGRDLDRYEQNNRGGREDGNRGNVSVSRGADNVRSSSRDNSRIENRTEKRNIQTQDATGLTGNEMKRNIFTSSMNQGQYQINQPTMQQSMQPQTFMTAQSQQVPMQFSNSNNIIDHSLPPVQNSPLSMPPMPPLGIGVRQDMSLPPPINVGGIPTSMIMQQPNNVHFQQQAMQQVSMQQQLQNMQPQFQQQQQQQFQHIQQQPQMMQQQQPNTQQFQSSVYQNNLRSNHQMPMQQMNSGQFQQNQSAMMPYNQSMLRGRVNQQPGAMSRASGSGQQVIKTSVNQQSYLATTPQQAVRSMLGRVRVSRPVNQVSNSPAISRPVAGPSRVPSSMEGNDEDEDDFLPEMLCSKCDKVYLSHEVMRRHGRWHDLIESNNKSWRCDQCEQGFSFPSGHAEHMSSKHSVHSWNCSLCDKTFTNSSRLNKHVRQASHKDLKVKYVCSLCPASFMVLMQLVQHKKENHQSSITRSGLRKY